MEINVLLSHVATTNIRGTLKFFNFFFFLLLLLQRVLTLKHGICPAFFLQYLFIKTRKEFIRTVSGVVNLSQEEGDSRSVDIGNTNMQCSFYLNRVLRFYRRVPNTQLI